MLINCGRSRLLMEKSPNYRRRDGPHNGDEKWELLCVCSFPTITNVTAILCTSVIVRTLRARCFSLFAFMNECRCKKSLNLSRVYKSKGVCNKCLATTLQQPCARNVLFLLSLLLLPFQCWCWHYWQHTTFLCVKWRIDFTIVVLNPIPSIW